MRWAASLELFPPDLPAQDASDEENNRLLLERLGETPAEKRLGPVRLPHGLGRSGRRDPSREQCGMPRPDPFPARGENGFGYDPLFEIVEYHRSFAEFGPLVKACLSHRARAARLMIPRLMELVDSGKMAD